MSDSEKQQFNLFVEPEVRDEFRKFAHQKGYGKKPSPLLKDLLAVYRPGYPELFKRLEEVLRKNPPTEHENRFYLSRIRDLIDEVLKDSSSQRPE